MIQLNVGGSDNGLGAIVGLFRHGNNGLRRMFRFTFARKRSALPTRIERWQIL